MEGVYFHIWHILFQAIFSKEDNLGQQAIHQAAQAGAVESLKLLVKEYGVDPSVSSSVQGVTPLHVAAKVCNFGKRADHLAFEY